jgi:hypothetical protein
MSTLSSLLLATAVALPIILIGFSIIKYALHGRSTCALPTWEDLEEKAPQENTQQRLNRVLRAHQVRMAQYQRTQGH